MRSNAGRSRGVARTDRRRGRPGSPPDRLAEARKQLAIALEDVDLEEEPELGDALTDAVIAVERTTGLASRREGEASRAWDRLVEDPGEDQESAPTEDEREGPPIESGGLQFVGEAGAE